MAKKNTLTVKILKGINLPEDGMKDSSKYEMLDKKKFREGDVLLDVDANYLDTIMQFQEYMQVIPKGTDLNEGAS